MPPPARRRLLPPPCRLWGLVGRPRHLPRDTRRRRRRRRHATGAAARREPPHGWQPPRRRRTPRIYLPRSRLEGENSTAGPAAQSLPSCPLRRRLPNRSGRPPSSAGCRLAARPPREPPSRRDPPHPPPLLGWARAARAPVLCDRSAQSQLSKPSAETLTSSRYPRPVWAGRSVRRQVRRRVARFICVAPQRAAL